MEFFLYSSKPLNKKIKNNYYKVIKFEILFSCDFKIIIMEIIKNKKFCIIIILLK